MARIRTGEFRWARSALVATLVALGLLFIVVPPAGASAAPEPKTEALRQTLRAWAKLQRDWTGGLRLAYQATKDNIGECDAAKAAEADGSDPNWPNLAMQSGNVIKFISAIDDQTDMLETVAKKFPGTVKKLNVVRRNRVESATAKILSALKVGHKSLFELTLAPGAIRKDHDCTTARIYRSKAHAILEKGWTNLVEGWQSLARVAGFEPPRPGDLDP